MKIKSKKTIIIGTILIILLVVLGIFVNQYLNEKANKEEAIELAKKFNFNKASNSNSKNEYTTIDDLRDKYLFGMFAEDIMLDDPNIYKQLGWNSEKATE